MSLSFFLLIWHFSLIKQYLLHEENVELDMEN